MCVYGGGGCWREGTSMVDREKNKMTNTALYFVQ